MKTRFPARIVLCIFASLLFIQATFGKDEWVQVRSKNFNLVGNASEKSVRNVAKKFEQFREVFRLVFTQTNLDSPIPTNIVVFKNDSSYKPFKPKRADGKTDNFIAGYFQPGADVNYITLTADGTGSGDFGTIFHEYVHNIVNINFGKSDVPAWFNEGLAEYYQTFAIEDDIKAKLGLPQGGHLQLLAQSKLIPLNDLFKVSNASLIQGGHSRSIFYAQSWAIMHYFLANGKSAELSKFLTLTMRDVSEEKAFQEAFGMNYAQMEKVLRDYVGKSTYKYTLVTFKNKINVEEMQASVLSESESNAYLGDLLYHTHRHDDAEPFLKASLSLDPNSSMANAALGAVKIKQRKFDEAKPYLDKAIAAEPKNYFPYYQYAYLLSREGRDEFGLVRGFPAETSRKMKELLRKTMQVNPNFTESYELFAFVSLVDGEGLDEAISAMQKAIRLQPGNQRYALRIAEIYMRQEKFDEANAIADKIARTTDDEEVKGRAESVLNHLRTVKEINARNEESRRRYEAAIAAGARPTSGRETVVITSANGKPPSAEEVEKAEREFMIRAINRELRPTEGDEIKVIANIEKMDCSTGTVVYTVKTENERFLLSSKDFQTVELATYLTDGGNAEIACNADVRQHKAVLFYKPMKTAVATNRGEMRSITFVPADFLFIEKAKDQNAPILIERSASGMPPPTNENVTTIDPSKDEIEKMGRDIMMNSIREALARPAAGQKQELAFLQRSECTNKAGFFYFRTGSLTLKLSMPAGGQPKIRAFTPDLEGVQFGCGMKAIEIPVVITYADAPDKKTKANGELLSMDFVPKNFTLE